jgi:cysteine-rich repeat protein
MSTIYVPDELKIESENYTESNSSEIYGLKMKYSENNKMETKKLILNLVILSLFIFLAAVSADARLHVRDCYSDPPEQGSYSQESLCCDSLPEGDAFDNCVFQDDSGYCPEVTTEVTAYCVQEFSHPFSVWGSSVAKTLEIPTEMIYMDDLGIRAFKSHIATVLALVIGKDMQDDRVWAYSDSLVDNAANYGIKPILTLSPKKGIDSNELPKTPEEMETYKDYIRATVSRYKNEVYTWQIVNELSVHWKDTAENYAELVRITVNEVRAIQPKAKFVLAGPATHLFGRFAEQDFLENVLIALEPYGNDWFDYLDIHFIGMGHPLENKHLEMIKWYSYFKNLLDSFGYTDIGYFAEVDSYGGIETDVTEREQSIDLLRKYLVGAALGFDQIHHNGQITENGGSINRVTPDGWYWDGLIYDPEVNNGLSHKKLAFYSLKKVIEVLDGFDKVQTVKQNDNGIFIYSYEKKGKQIYVAWNDNNDSRLDKLSFINKVRKVKITKAVPEYDSGEEISDYASAFNEVSSDTTRSGTVEIALDEVPVIVEEIEMINDPFCGDGNLDEGEQCDDGNNLNGDGCSAVCTVEPFCGDGNLDEGEQCDDGNNVDGDGCSAVCTVEPFCGNGNLDEGEQCDDGNNLNGDGCSAVCTIEPFCGDGNLNAGEQCDDGNNVDGDGCSAVCTIEPFCGDGNLDEGEQCDDGNTLDGDGCSAICTVEPICGDGIRQRGEQCDDGNTLDGDGCSAICRVEPICGDGIRQRGEQCDDGNTLDGDGCSAICTLER